MFSQKKTFAVIGASNDPEKYGYKIVEFLEARDYTVIPINPKEKTILHLQTYKSILDYPNRIDSVIFVVKPEVVLQILPQIIQKEIKEVWFQPGSESDAIIEFCKGKPFVPQFSCVMESIKIEESLNPEKLLHDKEIHLKTIPDVYSPIEHKLSSKKRPIVVVVVRVEKDNHVLLLKRNKEPYKGYWSLTGGKLELGETVAKAAIREVHEETGLQTTFNKIHAVLHEQVVDDDSGDFKHSLLLVYCSVTCDDSISLITPLHDLGEGKLQWFKISEIPEEKTIPSDYHMITQMSSLEAPFYEILQEDKRGLLGKMDIKKY